MNTYFFVYVTKPGEYINQCVSAINLIEAIDKLDKIIPKGAMLMLEGVS